MNQTPMAAPQAQAPSSRAMIATLGIIAMLSGFLVVLAYELTKPYIEENQRIATERAVFHVIPGATERRDFVLNERGLFAADAGERGITVYAGYDAEGDFLGVAAESAAQGYADLIHLLFGYNPACECITGIRVVRLAETPGLGDLIITDSNFQANFEALDARLAADGQRLANRIVTVKPGNKEHPWEIDGISGATVSANAVGRAVNEGAERLLPLLRPHIETLREAGA